MNLNTIATKRINNYPGRPTLVFLHDSLGCIELWRAFPEQLGELTECNVLVYDRQGYGQSCSFTYQQRNNGYLEEEADILIDLMNHWGIEQAILFGHSDGGSIALIAGGKYPNRIRGIITEGAHIFVEDITLSGIKEAIHFYRNTGLKSVLEKYHGDKTDAMFWAWAATWTTQEFKAWNIEHFLPEITCPCLIIQGEDDEYGTMEQVKRIVRNIQTSAVSFVIPKVKHTPHKEVPNIVLQKSTEFIKSII